MASMSDREHRQAERHRIRQVIPQELRNYWRDMGDAMQGVKFTVRKGFVDPDEFSEFKGVWKRLRAGEITQQQFGEWVTTFNSRPRGRQEFRI